jgi:conjugative relaxase-like TrwC/TraI family protein
MLSVIKLADAEYAIGQVAVGVEEYYLGEGEAPGVWAGTWAPALDLEGVVRDQELRSLVNGVDPRDGTWWLDGHPRRRVNAFDATFSAPKGVSLLWAFASPEVSSLVSRAHVQAVSEALAFLERRAAVSRQQLDGVRTRVGTAGWAVATFVHRTSRAGDPQLHTHCVVPNLVRRADRSYATLDAAVLYRWAKGAGSVYQEQLRRILTQELGVAWGPDRHGTREMKGFAPEQLRRFSKRTSAIEAYLARSGGVYQTAVARMRADHAASLATRPDKDRTLTPERLRERWAAEATAVGLAAPDLVESAVLGRAGPRPVLSFEAVEAALTDPEAGLCAHDSRFGEAQVVEAVAALGAGRLTVAEIDQLTRDFLASRHVVRLGVDPEAARRSPPQWTTTAHLALESIVLECVDTLAGRTVAAIDPAAVERAVAADRLGDDQAAAVRALCAAGPALRALVAPAGFGKTTAVHAAACAAAACGRPVLGVATTNRAVAELRDVGVPAVTIARLALELAERALAPGTVVVLDESSQTSTADARVVLGAVAEAPGAQLWCLGDARQAQAVGAGGLAAELEALGAEGTIPAPALTENRRQHHPAERTALAAWRRGELAASQAARAGAGLEHEHGTPTETREAMAEHVAADVLASGPHAVAALAVAHADCEDLADRIRTRLAAAGVIGGPALEGPGWGQGPRPYQAGDRVLLHDRAGNGARLHNGTTVTVTAVTPAGLDVVTVNGTVHRLPFTFVVGRRRDGRPNLSHAWCRTVDGSQGATFERAHLLGSATLDTFSAYVGQSRARVETHTWNVRAIPAGDWGGRLVDRRTGAEQVLDAAGRAPLKTFATHDAPATLDRQLRAEIAAHEAVLATGPPDIREDLSEARNQLAGAEQDVADARSSLGYALGRAGAIGPLEGLRRSGRDERARWHAAADGHGRDLARHEDAHARLAARVAELHAALATRRAFEQREGWRADAIAELRDRIDHHWRRAVIAVLRQGDPLAYGRDALRRAGATTAAHLRRLDAAIPPDRTRQLAWAEDELRRRRDNLRRCRRDEAPATRELERASRRRFGLRDRSAITAAEVRLADAHSATARMSASLSEAEATVAAERAGVAARTRAEAATSDERRVLGDDLEAITAALDASRPERVEALVNGDQVDQRLCDLLGEPPADDPGRRVWRELAGRVEAALDQPGGWTYLSWSPDPIDNLVHDLLEPKPVGIEVVRALVTDAAQESADGLGVGGREPILLPPVPEPDLGL